MTKILINGDSLGLPRSGVRYEETYPALLAQELAGDGIAVINRCRRAACMTSLAEPDALELYEPQIAIVQLGIVDCAPRLFRQRGFEHTIMQLMPDKVRNAYIRLIQRLRRRSMRRAYTTEQEFVRGAADFCGRAERTGCRVIFVPIARASKQYRLSNPDGGEAIERYNAALAETAARFPGRALILPPMPEQENEEYFLPDDGYHLSAVGNRDVGMKLVAAVREFLCL